MSSKILTSMNMTTYLSSFSVLSEAKSEEIPRSDFGQYGISQLALASFITSSDPLSWRRRSTKRAVSSLFYRCCLHFLSSHLFPSLILLSLNLLSVSPYGSLFGFETGSQFALRMFSPCHGFFVFPLSLIVFSPGFVQFSLDFIL
jgi:hypothetical protein